MEIVIVVIVVETLALLSIGAWLTIKFIRRRKQSTLTWKDGLSPDKVAYLPEDGDSPKETLRKHTHAMRESEQWQRVMDKHAAKIVRDQHDIGRVLGYARAANEVAVTDSEETAHRTLDPTDIN
jgi:hypothetical protein